MPNTLVNATLTPTSVLETFYTVPTGKSAVWFANTYNQESSASTGQAGLAILRSGQTTPSLVADALSVSANTSVNLLPAKYALMAGDKLQGRNLAAAPFSKIVPAGSSSLPPSGSAGLMLCNTAGTTIVVVMQTTGQIWTSVNSGLTWSLTRAPVPNAPSRCGVYFGGYFYVYLSGTSYIRSADGITWTAPAAATNAPTVESSTPFGGVITVAGVLYWNNQARLFSSTDAITWSNYGVTFPATAATGFCWTGTRWIVAQNSATNNIYWSTNGAAWTTVAIGSGLSPSAYNCLSSDGAGTVILTLGAGSGYASYDSGTTWAINNTTGSSNGGTYWTGSRFVIAGSSAVTIGTIVVAGSITFKTFDSTVGYSGTLNSGDAVNALSATKVLGPLHVAYGFFASTDLALTPRGGASMIASVMEVS